MEVGVSIKVTKIDGDEHFPLTCRSVRILSIWFRVRLQDPCLQRSTLDSSI
ncbi:MAG: hypothetical protein ACE5OP_01035 [Candidatus Glassbacteria bacterium]